MIEQVFCVYDWETRSTADLKQLGQTEYARHPSTEILCCAFRIGTRKNFTLNKTQSWSPLLPDWQFTNAYQNFINALFNPAIILVCHNVQFEYAVTKYVLAGRLLQDHRALAAAVEPPERWLCTASLAAAMALPRSLEGAGAALGLPVQKSMEGRKLLLKMCKPRRMTMGDMTSQWHESPEDLKALIDYCVRDVDTEVELFLKARPLIPQEREIWKLDAVINQRGVQIDRELVTRSLKMIAMEAEFLAAETKTVTGGEITSTRQVEKTLAWLSGEKLHIPDLTAKTVKDALAAGLGSPAARRLLEIRQATSKSSTAKYAAFEARSRFDGRMRDNLIYHGTSTGRFSGSGAQVQNLPRPALKQELIEYALSVVKDEPEEQALDWLRVCYGNPMNVFSDLLRSVIVAGPGTELFAADYAAIELRVCFWMADHTKGLAALRNGDDLYVDLAQDIYGQPKASITKDKRFIGKSAVLGAQYQLSHAKFQKQMLGFGVSISEDFAKAVIKAYRTKHRPVVLMWSNLEKAMVAAIQNPGKAYTINHTKWFMQDKFLWCELPSGRRLAYAYPEVKMETPHWGGEEKKPRVYYWCVNGVTRQWERTATFGGAACENVCSGTSRDIMTTAMLKLEAAGYKICMSVHDELVGERTIDEGNLDEFCRIMAEPPPWGRDIPINVEGFVSDRYRK
jgi:DNA polymerase